MKTCFYGCGKTDDLRPFGPQGQWVCFKCSMLTSDRKQQTESQFEKQLDACGGIAIGLEETGPRSFIPGNN